MTRISEDYVSFETAKLLKEKGFNEDCLKYYIEGRKYIRDLFDEDWPHRLKNSKAKENVVTVSTLQMAMKWLREVHNLVIQIELIDFLEHGEVWFYSIIERKTIKQLTCKDEDFTEHSYEQAAEAAIRYCLEHLI